MHNDTCVSTGQNDFVLPSPQLVASSLLLPSHFQWSPPWVLAFPLVLFWAALNTSPPGQILDELFFAGDCKQGFWSLRLHPLLRWGCLWPCGCQESGLLYNNDNSMSGHGWLESVMGNMHFQCWFVELFLFHFYFLLDPVVAACL